MSLSYVLVSDLFRFYVVVTALWLAALFLKMTWTRYRTSGSLVRRQQTPHPLVTLGLAVLMVLAVMRRFDNLGQPGDVYLWGVTGAVSLILAGVVINVHFDLAPPWRRQQHPR